MMIASEREAELATHISEPGIGSLLAWVNPSNGIVLDRVA